MKCCLLIDPQKMSNFKYNFFLNKKYECGGLFNVVIYILFYGDNS
jgi:hypothetical protein